MARYEISVTVDLDNLDEQRLANALRVEQDALDKALARLATAAAKEWLDQILAQRLPTRIKDARELRLLHYALQVNAGQLPPPEQIADLFHVTAPEARTLHRNTRTRYSFELAQGLIEALAKALTEGRWVEKSEIGGYVRVHLDEALVEYVELLLSWGNQTAERITKDKNYDDYRVPLSAFRVLCTKAVLDYEQVLKTVSERT